MYDQLGTDSEPEDVEHAIRDLQRQLDTAELNNDQDQATACRLRISQLKELLAEIKRRLEQQRIFRLEM